MAIDDNTSYELTGAQVKDLASKINAKADSSSLATVATSGSYTDLINTPAQPTVNDGTLTIQQNGVTVGSFTANQSSAATVSLTDTTYSAMTGATSGTAGTSGLVPAPAAGDEAKVLSGAGAWVSQSGGGSSTVIYYADSTSTAGFQLGTINGPYIYKDAARTTIATPKEIYDNFQAGNPIHIEYESTQTGASAFAMTLEVTTMSLNGSDTYSMVLNEVNEETPGDSRDLVMLRLHASWDGQSTFSSRWAQQRKYIHDGTLTIKHNGTTKGTFTANQYLPSTVNIETIYADDYISTSPIPTTVTTAMIENGAVTAAKIDWTTMPDNYSTTEVDTGTTWIDGKHIYKKTIDYGWLPNNTTKNVNHGISNFGRLVKAEATANSNGNWSMMPLVFQGDASNFNVEFQVTSTYIHMSSNTDRSSWRECIVTLWYTKTS